MNRLLILRHGISNGNEQGIIQGITDYPLSLNGMTDTLNLAYKNYNIMNNFNRIICSPLKRTKETANIISNIINKEVSCDDLLKEISAGILDGLTKEEAKVIYYEYLKIWQMRGDLDLIPGATSGDEIQARVLMFLERYLHEECNDIIVSHAGFNRCLINTINGVKRNNDIDMSHNRIYQLSNIFKNMEIKKHLIAKNSIVTQFNTIDRNYIIKRCNRNINENDYLELELSNYLSEHIKVPKIYRLSDKGDYIIKALEYLKGKNCNGKLNDEQIKNTITELYKMQGLMERFLFYRYTTEDILNKLITYTNFINNEDVKKIGTSLLKSELFINALKNDKLIFVHDDLHRDNILYDGNNVSFLDFEGVEKNVKTYQLASHIAICYILNDFDFNINKVLELWPEKVQLNYLYYLILYRLYKGLVFFEEKIEKNSYNDDDINLRDKYYKCLTKVKERVLE